MRAALRRVAKGVDPERVGFGLRTALAACLALTVAWALGLEHPQWSAMTVWAASQPVRGMLIEKSCYRALGTLIGTLAGVALLALVGEHTAGLVVGLAVWVGLCAGTGNLLHGLRSYGALLAGYSASMVALLGQSVPMGFLALGIDRFATVMIGVLVALIIGLLFGARPTEDEASGRARRLMALVLQRLAQRLRGQMELSTAEVTTLLSEAAAIEATLDAHGAGSSRGRHSARSLRAVLAAQVEALLWLERPDTLPRQGRALAEALDEAAETLEASSARDAVLAPLARAESLAADSPALVSVLQHLAEAHRQRTRYHATGTTRGETLKRQVVRHRDWVHGRQALLRTSSVMLIVGAAWAISGWSPGAYVLLGTSVMVTLFSTFDNPAWLMRRILAWQAVGAVAALICRWWLWPLATSEWQQLAMLMPFILLAVLPFAHRRTMTGSVDSVMILLLLSQPGLPLDGDVAGSLTMALAVVTGPLLAVIAFTLVFPTDARRRQRRLKAMMIRELQAMAARPDSANRAEVWQARLHHRIMALMQWSHGLGDPAQATTRGSLAVFDLGRVVLALQALREDDALSSRERQAILATLRHLASLRQAPAGVADALARLGGFLSRRNRDVAQALHQAADHLRREAAFFRHSRAVAGC